MIRELDKLELPVLALDPTGALASEDSFVLKMESVEKEELNVVLDVVQKTWRAKIPLVLDVSELTREDMSILAGDLFDMVRVSLSDGIVMVDEIPDFTPQFGKFKSEELIRFNRKCRNQNIGFMFATQRPQSVDKDVLALADIFFVLRVVYPPDRKRMEELFSQKYEKGEEAKISTEISSFGPGEVYVVSFVLGDRTGAK